MKLLPILGIVGALILAAVALGVLLAPTQLKIQNKIKVSVSPDLVFPKIANLENYHLWSPWLATDPNQKHFVTGDPGQTGSSYHWEGVNEKSKGTQTIENIKDNKLVEMGCQIVEPFKSSPKFIYKISDIGVNETEIQLEFESSMPRPFNLIGKLLDLKTKISETNQKALMNLKQLCESERVTAYVHKGSINHSK